MEDVRKLRTKDVVPAAGIWRNVCARPGCEFVEELELLDGAPAPPCRHCCNHSQLEFVSPPSPEAPRFQLFPAIVESRIRHGWLPNPGRNLPWTAKDLDEEMKKAPAGEESGLVIVSGDALATVEKEHSPSLIEQLIGEPAAPPEETVKESPSPSTSKTRKKSKA